MPLAANVRDVAQHALVDHLLGRLVELAVAPLQAALQHLLGMLGHQRPQRVYFFRLVHQALLAEDVLARLQAVFGDRKVLVQRHGDQHRVDILARQQLAVVLVWRWIIAGGIHAFFQVDVPVVAHRHAAARVGFVEVLEQVSAAASGPDKSVLHLVVGSVYLLDEGRALGRGQGCGDSRNGAGRLYKIAAGDIVIMCHAGLP